MDPAFCPVERDYETWACIFFVALEPGGQYSTFLSDCSDLIISVFTENQLPEPISSYTHTFLHETIPRATTAVLHFTVATESEFDFILPFLESVLLLGVWAVSQDYEDLFFLLSDILQPDQFLYARTLNPTEEGPEGPSANAHQTLLESFVENGHFDTILNRITDPDRPPLIGAFLLFYTLLNYYQIEAKWTRLSSLFSESLLALGAYFRQSTICRSCGHSTGAFCRFAGKFSLSF
jgi:hypothetical protein